MAKIKVSEATGRVLDWVAAKCEGLLDPWGMCAPVGFRPSDDWSQGGPIIERERMAVTCTPVDWCAYRHSGVRRHAGFETYAWTHKHVGPTPLIAAMRCYVASKLGEEVEVPDALLEP